MTQEPITIKKIVEDKMEELADIEHQRWSDWHKYCMKNWNMENLDRWAHQSETPYKDLSEQEKESDREQVRRYLPILTSSLNQLLDSIKIDEEEMSGSNTTYSDTSFDTSAVIYGKILAADQFYDIIKKLKG